MSLLLQLTVLAVAAAALLVNGQYMAWHQEEYDMCNSCPSMIVTDENKLRLEVSMEVSHQIHEALRSLENMDEMLANIDREVANCGESKVEVPGSSPNNPSSSCMSIHDYYPLAPSGTYYIHNKDGSKAVPVYCDMTRTCGGIKGGWTLVAKLDMTNRNNSCPKGLTQRPDYPKRTCTCLLYTSPSPRDATLSRMPSSA